MHLTPAQYERESRYRLAFSMIQSFFAKGLLTKAEYQQAQERLLDQYNPIWSQYPDATKSLSYRELS